MNLHNNSCLFLLFEKGCFLYFIKVYVSFVGSGISVAYQTEEISALAHSPGEQHSFSKIHRVGTVADGMIRDQSDWKRLRLPLLLYLCLSKR
jgi:hypothetical protein